MMTKSNRDHANEKNTGFSVKLGNYDFTERWNNKQWLIHCGVKQNFKRLSNDNSSNRTGEVQANKSTGRMPWHQEPTKDVTSCDKLR